MSHILSSETAASPTLDSQRRYLCRHVHAKGHRCGSPALRGKHFCYYHDRTRQEVPSSRIGTFAMPRVDDRAAIQIALFEVLARLASGDIDYKRGTSILYGLQIASANLSQDKLSTAIDAPPVVEDILFDPRFGDLAPIAELPTAEPATETNGEPTAEPLRPKLIAS